MRTYANNSQDDYEQWFFFTSDGNCFTAGPGTSYEYGPASSQKPDSKPIDR